MICFTFQAPSDYYVENCRGDCQGVKEKARNQLGGYRMMIMGKERSGQCGVGFGGRVGKT